MMSFSSEEAGHYDVILLCQNHQFLADLNRLIKITFGQSLK